jgi:hypothetical protein
MSSRELRSGARSSVSPLRTLHGRSSSRPQERCACSVRSATMANIRRSKSRSYALGQELSQRPVQPEASPHDIEHVHPAEGQAALGQPGPRRDRRARAPGRSRSRARGTARQARRQRPGGCSGRYSRRRWRSTTTTRGAAGSSVTLPARSTCCGVGWPQCRQTFIGHPSLPLWRARCRRGAAHLPALDCRLRRANPQSGPV